MDIIERRLVCPICMDNVSKDACQFLCTGQHAVCFSCVVQYCESLRANYANLKCPICNNGDGSFFFSSLYSELSTRDDTTNMKSRFTELQDDILDENKTLFGNNGKIIICPLQLRIFLSKLRTTPRTILRTEERHIERQARQRRTELYRRLPSGTALQWITVNINEQEGSFYISVHDSEIEAIESSSRLRPRYNVCFITEIRGNTIEQCVVVLQQRPIHLNMMISFDWYLEQTFQLDSILTNSIRDSVERSVRVLVPSE